MNVLKSNVFLQTLNNYLFEKEILISCFQRQAEHARYQNAITLFITSLKEYLPDTINNIDDFLKPKTKQQNNASKIVVTYSKKGAKPFTKKTKDTSYEFSKLFQGHPIFGIDFFKRKFNKNKAILNELVNMENNKENKLEYYASYEYLRILLIQKKYLKA